MRPVLPDPETHFQLAEGVHAFGYVRVARAVEFIEVPTCGQVPALVRCPQSDSVDRVIQAMQNRNLFNQRELLQQEMRILARVIELYQIRQHLRKQLTCRGALEMWITQWLLSNVGDAATLVTTSIPYPAYTWLLMVPAKTSVFRKSWSHEVEVVWQHSASIRLFTAGINNGGIDSGEIRTQRYPYAKFKTFWDVFYLRFLTWSDSPWADESGWARHFRGDPTSTKGDRAPHILRPLPKEPLGRTL